MMLYLTENEYESLSIKYHNKFLFPYLNFEKSNISIFPDEQFFYFLTILIHYSDYLKVSRKFIQSEFEKNIQANEGMYFQIEEYFAKNNLITINNDNDAITLKFFKIDQTIIHNKVLGLKININEFIEKIQQSNQNDSYKDFFLLKNFITSQLSIFNAKNHICVNFLTEYLNIVKSASIDQYIVCNSINEQLTKIYKQISQLIHLIQNTNNCSRINLYLSIFILGMDPDKKPFFHLISDGPNGVKNEFIQQMVSIFESFQESIEEPIMLPSMQNIQKIELLDQSALPRVSNFSGSLLHQPPQNRNQAELDDKIDERLTMANRN